MYSIYKVEFFYTSNVVFHKNIHNRTTKSDKNNLQQKGRSDRLLLITTYNHNNKVCIKTEELMNKNNFPLLEAPVWKVLKVEVKWQRMK